MTPQEIATSLKQLTSDQLGKLDHASLYNARNYVPKGMQNAISPYEHRAFAREATAENPLMGLPIAAGVLAYQPYKAITGESRSAPALNQVGQGLYGVGEGLWAAFQRGTQSIKDRIESTGIEMPSIDHLESLRSYLPGSNRASKPRQ
jgi:hypothetical protein